MDEPKKKSEPVAIPLSSMIQSARVYIYDAVSQIMDKTGLPPYLMDGVLSEVLADIRKKELCEMSASVSYKKELGCNE